ncbi:hypothetical protein P8C59_006726 [Phyllachora maydis]|uniref:Amidase domain-containing protein n=1 Tax=Phyllachora maydis TaxID=1825666 RepID=A0AAD9I851_9PEZI|nr:hypothetical protein P8C59_006726 [Phyllachora maydis]
MNDDWQALVGAKQRELETAIPPEWRVPQAVWAEGRENGRLIEQGVVEKCGILSQRELDMTESYTAADLLHKLATRDLTSVELTTAFSKRAAIAQQLTCCLTEIFFERALERAKWLDSHLEREGTVLGPLHGLPVSVKDCFQVEGTHATCGFVALLQQEKSTANSAMAELLLDAGAVLYVKTNIPQTLMTADSENHIYGRVLNPHNTRLTAGGSTGGEGALLALRGSPLGLGTDMAGSTRIPALCCGVYGFKPSPGRLPLRGSAPGPGPPYLLPGLDAAAGPMGGSVADLALFMRAAAARRPERFDPAVLPLPWRERACAAAPAPLRIGLLPEDAAFPLHPPVRRALAAAAAALAAAGHALVPLRAEAARSADRGTRIAWGFFALHGSGFGADLLAAAAEPPVASVAAQCHPFGPGRPPIAPDPDADGGDWRATLTALAAARGAYAHAWARAWREERLDVVLAPGAQGTAVPHDTFGLPPYTIMWNVIDYPGCVIPFGRASKELDPDAVVYGVPFQPDYDPAATDRAPCAVQVVAPKFKDEECLRAAAMIDHVLKQYCEPSCLETRPSSTSFWVNAVATVGI